MSSTDEDTTQSSDVRWEYTSTIASLLIVASFALLLIGDALGRFSLSSIEQGWFLLYGTVVLASVIYIFGEETLAAVKKFRE